MSHRILAVAIAATLAGCTGSDAVPGYSRETTPDGRVIVSYASGLPVREDTLVPQVEIAKYVSDSSRIFDDLRDLAVDDSGRILALDYKAAEIRVFGPDGSPRGTIGRRGEGPGEFTNANGLRITDDGTIWVNDHGKSMMLELAPDGTERQRVPGIVPGFGYRWDVTVDTAGVFWKRWTQRSARERPDMSFSGVVEGSSLPMYQSFDPATGTRDSVLTFAPMHYRTYVRSYANGQTMMGLPFDGREFILLDRHRRAWLGASDRYDLARITLASDTALELHVAEQGPAITEDDIAEWKEGLAWASEEIPDLATDLLPYMPETKPVLGTMFTDDQDRLWVGRTVPAGDLARWDVFSPDGQFLVTIRAPSTVVTELTPVVRSDRIYLFVEGEAGERYIVVAELPVGLVRNDG